MGDPAKESAAKPTNIRFLVLAWLCALATLAYIHRGCIAVPLSEIQKDLGFNKEDAGQILFAFFLGYSFFQIPSGWLGDRWGTRRALTLFILLWSLATGWMGIAGGFLGLWIARLLNGIAQAGIFPSSVNSISLWFPETGKAFPCGLLGSFMSVGAVISTTLTGFLLQYLTWRQVFVVLSLPGVVAALLFYWWFRDRPEQHAGVNAEEIALIRTSVQAPVAKVEFQEESAAENAPVWWTLLTSFQNWMICGQQFFRAAGYIFYLTWFPTFLQEARCVSVSESGYLTSLPLLGIVVGSGVGGAVMDYIYRVTGNRQLSRQGIGLLGVLGCTILVYLAYFVWDPLLTTILLTLGSISVGLCGAPSYTVTMDLGGRHVATVFSTMNMVGNFGAALLPLVIVPLINWQSWNESLLLLAGLYWAASVCWMLLDMNKNIFPK